MIKKLSGWHRLFIVFAGLWTVGSIGFLTIVLSEVPNMEQVERDWLYERKMNRARLDAWFNQIKKPTTRLEQLLLEQKRRKIITPENQEKLDFLQSNDVPDSEELYPIIENLYNKELSMYHAKIRNAIFYFPLYWFAPIGLVFGSGWCVGWIIRRFQKDKE